MSNPADQLEGLGNYEFGWSDSDSAGAVARRGLNEDVVRDISAKKNKAPPPPLKWNGAGWTASFDYLATVPCTGSTTIGC